MRYVFRLVSTFVLLISILLVPLSIACCSPTEESENGNGNGSGQEPTVDWASDGVITDGEYVETVTYGNFQLLWRNDDTKIYIGMKVKTTGWISLGIKPSSAMKDADMILGYVDGGETTLTDQYGTSTFGHQLDTDLGGTDDIIAYGGSYDGEYTVIEFSRTLAVDDEYDQPITSGANAIIWAYGSTDTISVKHSTRGSGTLTL